MATTATSYATNRLFGPFYRRDRTDGARIIAGVLATGVLGGCAPRGSDIPAVKAYAGELPDGVRGFELYAFAEPDRPAGKVMLWRSRDDGMVWEEGGEARIKVLVSRVDQEIQWPP